jgi:hypothetical protein
MKLVWSLVFVTCAGLVLAPAATADHSSYLGIAASWGGEGTAPGQFRADAPPYALASGLDGSIYALHDSSNLASQLITRFDSDGNFLGRWGDRPGDVTMDGAADLAVGASGAVYVTTTGGDPNSVLKFSPNGSLLARWDGTNGTQAFREPLGITADGEGNVYVDAGTPESERSIVQLTEDGTVVREFGGPGYRYLARDDDGYLFGALSYAVGRTAPSGIFDGFIGPQDFGLSGAGGVTVAADGTVWAVDYGDYRILRYTREGELLDICGRADGSGPLTFPRDVATSGASIVVADSLNIRRIGMVTHPDVGCDALAPTLTDIELLIKGGLRKWFKRSAVSFSTSEPAHATLKLQKRIRRHNRRRWRGLDRGRADLEVGQNKVDFSDVLDVKPKPRAGRYRIKLRLDDEADNLSRVRKRKFSVG